MLDHQTDPPCSARALRRVPTPPSCRACVLELWARRNTVASESANGWRAMAAVSSCTCCAACGPDGVSEVCRSESGIIRCGQAQAAGSRRLHACPAASIPTVGRPSRSAAGAALLLACVGSTTSRKLRRGHSTASSAMKRSMAGRRSCWAGCTRAVRASVGWLVLGREGGSARSGAGRRASRRAAAPTQQAGHSGGRAGGADSVARRVQRTHHHSCLHVGLVLLPMRLEHVRGQAADEQVGALPRRAALQQGKERGQAVLEHSVDEVLGLRQRGRRAASREQVGEPDRRLGAKRTALPCSASQQQPCPASQPAKATAAAAAAGLVLTRPTWKHTITCGASSHCSSSWLASASAAWLAWLAGGGTAACCEAPAPADTRRLRCQRMAWKGARSREVTCGRAGKCCSM